MIRLYVIGGLSAALAALAGGVAWYVSDLQAEIVLQVTTIDRLTLQLAGCNARAENIIRDKESDDAIDRLSPDDLRNLPTHWMRPSYGSGSLY